MLSFQMRPIKGRKDQHASVGVRSGENSVRRESRPVWEKYSSLTWQKLAGGRGGGGVGRRIIRFLDVQFLKIGDERFQ